MARWILIVLAVLGAWPCTAQEKAAIYPQLGHAGFVSSIAFSPDGRLLASGSGDKSIKLWDVASARELLTLTGHSSFVLSIAFSADGKMLASGGDDKSIILWNPKSGRALRTLVGHSGRVRSVAFSPDGKLLASGNDDGTVKLWEVANGKELRTLTGTAAVSSVTFSSDGKLLAVGGIDTVELWDVRKQRRVGSFKEQSGLVNSVAFSPDGTLLAVGKTDNAITLWDVSSGSEARTLSGHSGSVKSVAFSPDGKMLASGSWDKTIRLWEVATGRELRTLTPLTPQNSNAPILINSVAFSPDGTGVASGDVSGQIKLWDVATGRERSTFSGSTTEVLSVAVSPDGKTVASARFDRTIKLWGLASGKELGTLDGHTYSVNSVAFSRDGKILASGSNDNTVKLWDVGSARALRTFEGHSHNVNGIAFSPDGKTLASASLDRSIKLWDVASGQNLRTFTGHSISVNCVAFSPDGKTLASGGGDRTVKIWDVASGRELKTLVGHTDFVVSVAFSPDGKTLASASFDHTIKLWDVASGQKLYDLVGHSDSVYSVAYSPDGKLLASGSWDKTIKLWDPANGRELRSFGGYPVRPVAFSVDGKVLISGGLDGATRVWDVSTGKERASFIHFKDGSSIAVTPEGFFDSSSEQAEENLNVRVGNRVFGISSFRGNFYRPDLVKRALAGEDVSQFGSIDNVKLSPVVEFASLPATTTDSNLKLTLKLTNGGGGFGPVRIFWDGTVIEQDGDLPPSADTLTRSYAVPLSIGDNEVRTTVANADFSMASDMRANVTVNLPPVAKAANAHGTLHAIVIGVQEFPKAPGNNLSYPNADAKLMADTLNAAAAPLFERLDIPTPLTGAANTDKAHIVQALEDMRATAKPEDEFVFYVAGHGTVAAGQYYLMTSDSASPDPSSLKASAISARELSDLIANIHVAKKLVILDTCDSGAAGTTFTQANAGLDVKTAATILARDYGFTVLAAAESNQEAQESGYQKHGLFSFVIADGLAGKAADAGSGIVSSFLLANYVKSQVPIIAQTVLHHAQQPTSETSGNTFDITKVK